MPWIKVAQHELPEEDENIRRVKGDPHAPEGRGCLFLPFGFLSPRNGRVTFILLRTVEGSRERALQSYYVGCRNKNGEVRVFSVLLHDAKIALPSTREDMEVFACTDRHNLTTLVPIVDYRHGDRSEAVENMDRILE